MTEDTKIILERLDQVDSKIDQLDSNMESRMGKVESRMGKVESRMGKVESRMGKVESKMDKVESRMDKMESAIDEVKSQMTGIKLVLENEIRRNIQIIAEGHLDLSRKLDDAVKVKEEREQLLLRTNVLESDVRMLKDKVNKLSSVS